MVEADCWPLLTVAYDLPRNGLLGVCSSDREADEKIRLNLYININITFAIITIALVTLFLLAYCPLQNRLREAKGVEGVKHQAASKLLAESLTDSLEETSGIYWGASCKKKFYIY